LLLPFDPRSTTLEVRQEGQDKAIVTLPNANFEKGKFYTIVVTGYAKGTPKLETLIVEDQLGTAPTASTGLQKEKIVKTQASKY
jgi:subtilase family serine protease